MGRTAGIMMLLSGLCLLPACFPRQYLLVKELKTWTEAQSYCRERYTDLASAHSEQDLAQLNDLIGSYALVWIGLQADDKATWRWSLENPDNYDKEAPSFFMFTEGTQNSSSSFVLVEQNMTCEEAQSYCRENYTDLASVRNQTENDQIEPQGLSGDTWIGLCRDCWKWSDGSRHSFRNLETVAPATKPAHSCVASRFGQWIDSDCSSQYFFACYFDKSAPKTRRQVVRVVLKKSDSSVDMEELKDDILQKFQQSREGGGPE
uniref:layilin-like n=1 Tax=Semicossyphus pulcher TaxID=241346 RepID=UPI0037E766F5